MRWPEIRKAYPSQWLVVEALKAHTTSENRRLMEELAVMECCSDGGAALEAYRRLHRQHPEREFYFVHTSREELDIVEQHWLGVRRSHAVGAQG